MSAPIYADIYVMKKKFIVVFVLFVSVVIPFQLMAQGIESFQQEGIASWYGREFEGRPTASGEIFDSSQLTAAHPNLPFGTMIVVTNLHNNKSVTVKVNDRGPFVPARIVDISRAAAERLDMIVTGTAPVRIESAGSQINSPAVGAQMQPVPQVVITQAAPVFVTQPVVVQPLTQVSQARLSPSINIAAEKSYRLQVGSFRVARNAVDAFDRLKSAGLNPAYERFNEASSEYYRVVIAGVRGSDVQLIAERLSAAGFREALIREEN